MLEDNPMLRGIAVLCLLMGLLELGCQGLGSRGPTQESQVDMELARQVSSAPPPVVPEKPQKGFEQEPPKAQTP